MATKETATTTTVAQTIVDPDTGEVVTTEKTETEVPVDTETSGDGEDEAAREAALALAESEAAAKAAAEVQAENERLQRENAALSERMGALEERVSSVDGKLDTLLNRVPEPPDTSSVQEVPENTVPTPKADEGEVAGAERVNEERPQEQTPPPSRKRRFV